MQNDTTMKEAHEIERSGYSAQLSNLFTHIRGGPDRQSRKQMVAVVGND